MTQADQTKIFRKEALERIASPEQLTDYLRIPRAGAWIILAVCLLLLIALLAYEYDLGFLFVPDTKRSALRYMIERRQLAFTPLLDTDLVLYVGTHHPLASRSSVTAEEVAALSFISWRMISSPSRISWLGNPPFAGSGWKSAAWC